MGNALSENDTNKATETLSVLVQSQPAEITSWSDLEAFFGDLDGGLNRWCFRGHRCSEWPLLSSFDRAILTDRHRVERFLIHEFQRTAHHSLRSLPDKEDTLTWLSIMQHHGTPTRLLDFTLSPYVALYFSLQTFPVESRGQPNFSAGLWAVNYVSCKGVALGCISDRIGKSVTHGELLSTPAMFNKCFMEAHRGYFVAPLRPDRYNERQNAQQAIFLCPSSLDYPFETIFVQPPDFSATMAGEKGDYETLKQNLRRLVRFARINEKGAKEIVPRLQRMNINAASLFPGIDGYAQSIKEILRAQLLLPLAERFWTDFIE